MLHFLEIIAVLLNLLYVYFAVKVNPKAWIFGALAAASSAFYFHLSKLPGSAVLNMVYFIQGIIGYLNWIKGYADKKPAYRWSLRQHLIWSAIIITLSFSLLELFRYLGYEEFNSKDIFFALFSILATVLEIRKDISCWYYWIICNFCYTVLYALQPMYFYSALMLFLGIYSIYGLKAWRARLNVEI